MSVISFYVATSVKFLKTASIFSVIWYWVKGWWNIRFGRQSPKAKSLSGHPGRKARFLAGPLQDTTTTYWTPCFCVQCHIEIAGVEGLEPHSGTVVIGWLISLRELDAKQGSESFGWRCFLQVLSLAKQNQTNNVPWIVAVPFLPGFLLQGRVKGKSLSSSRIHPQMICMRCWIFATFTVPRSPVGSWKQFVLCFSWGQKTQPWEQGCCSMVWSWSLMWRICLQTQQQRPWIVEYWRDEQSRI